MIVTLTANPSLDRTVTLGAALVPGEVQTATAAREDAGGKGINVSRVIAAAGVPTRAVLPLAAHDPFDALLEATGLDAIRVPIAGQTRANITVADPDGVTTKLNLPGAALEPDEASAIVAAVVAACEGADWLVLAGSLPPGAGEDFYVRVIDAVRDRYGEDSPLVAVDTSGPALAAVVASARPDLVKPNDEEIAELAGTELASGDVSEVLAIAADVVPSKSHAALITLGAAGAVFVDRDGAWHATPPQVRVASTVGAGDSSLAGYLVAAAAGAAAEERLRSAVRYGAAAASLPGTQAPAPADLPPGDVTITRLR